MLAPIHSKNWLGERFLILAVHLEWSGFATLCHASADPWCFAHSSTDHQVLWEVRNLQRSELTWPWVGSFSTMTNYSRCEEKIWPRNGFVATFVMLRPLLEKLSDLAKSQQSHPARAALQHGSFKWFLHLLFKASKRKYSGYRILWPQQCHKGSLGCLDGFLIQYCN